MLLYICLCRMEQCEIEKSRHSQACSLPPQCKPSHLSIRDTFQSEHLLCKIAPLPQVSGPQSSSSLPFPHTKRLNIEYHLKHSSGSPISRGCRGGSTDPYPHDTLLCEAGHPPMCSCTLINSFVVVIMQQKLGL